MNNSYWNERASVYGHTGWSVFSTYYYDQHVRMKIIKNVVLTEISRFGLALDYGCGVGDFSKLLSTYFKQVYAFDTSFEVVKIARRVNKKHNIRYDSEFFNFFIHKYDLILSITVLQHIIDDDELARVFDDFGRAITKHGKLILIESFSINKMSSNYLKARHYEKIITLLKSNGFILSYERNLSHPTYSPSIPFQRYSHNYIVRFLNQLCRFNFYGAKFLLNLIAKHYSKNDVGIIDFESITKLLVFEFKSNLKL